MLLSKTTITPWLSSNALSGTSEGSYLSVAKCCEVFMRQTQVPDYRSYVFVARAREV